MTLPKIWLSLSPWLTLTLTILLLIALLPITVNAFPRITLIYQEESSLAEAQHVVFAATDALLPDLALVKTVQKVLGLIRQEFPQVREIKNSGLWKIGKVILSNYFDDFIKEKIEKKFGSLAYMNVVEHKKQHIATVITRKAYNSLLLAKEIEKEFSITATPDFNPFDDNSVQYSVQDSNYNFFKGTHYWTFTYDKNNSKVILNKEGDLDQIDQTSEAPPSAPLKAVTEGLNSEPAVFYQLQNGTLVLGTEAEIDKLVEQDRIQQGGSNNASIFTSDNEPKMTSELLMTVQLSNGTIAHGTQAEMDKIIEQDYLAATASPVTPVLLSGIILHLKNGSITDMTSQELQDRLKKQGRGNKSFDTVQLDGFGTVVELQNDTLIPVNKKDLEELLDHRLEDTNVHKPKSQATISDEEEAEQLVLEQISCQDLLPESNLVEKVKMHLSIIRSKFPVTKNIRHHGFYHLGKVMVVKVADSAICQTLNESLYGPILSVDTFPVKKSGLIKKQTITFPLHYNPRLLALTLLRDLRIPAKSMRKSDSEQNSVIMFFSDKYNPVYRFISRDSSLLQNGQKAEYTFKIDSKTGDVGIYEEALNFVECPLRKFTSSSGMELTQNDF